MKRKMVLILTAIAMGMMLTSCATIVSGSTASIHIDGDVDEPVTITTSLQTYEDQSLPTVVKIKRKQMDGQHINISSEHYKFKDIVLTKTTNEWAFGNILLGGLIGLTIDLITNSVSKPEQSHFFIKKSPIEKESGE